MTPIDPGVSAFALMIFVFDSMRLQNLGEMFGARSGQRIVRTGGDPQ
jgi:hypothetical protein